MRNTDITVANGVVYDGDNKIGRYEMTDGTVSELVIQNEERVDNNGDERPLLAPLLRALCEEARSQGHGELALELVSLTAERYGTKLKAEGFSLEEDCWVKRL